MNQNATQDKFMLPGTSLDVGLNKAGSRSTIVGTRTNVHGILKEARNIVFSTKPLVNSRFQVENIKWTYVFYEDGLEVNVIYTVDNPKTNQIVNKRETT